MTPLDGSASDFAILVIDDDSFLRRVLSDYLEEAGYRVCAERSGETGLAVLHKEPFDIVITDLRMPGMGGIEVVRRVKEKRPATEVIVVTGYATIQDGVDAMKEGAYDFLLKPLKVDQMDAVLTRCIQWIQHKRSHAELEAVNRKLLQLSRMKDRFLAVTDHELRTPVTVLDGMLHLLFRQNPDLPERVRDRLDSLCQVSRRLVHLVRDVHEVAQGRLQKFSVDLAWTTVDALARSIELDFEMARFSRNLEFELVTAIPTDYRFRADIQRLQYAVTELIQNAVKATPDGGRVETRVYRSDSEESPRLCVAATDTGVGIPRDEQQKIFEVFYGLGDELYHHSSKLEFNGSGLGIGLPLALQIAKAHGGGLELSSNPGCGSTFTLWVPVEQCH